MSNTRKIGLFSVGTVILSAVCASAAMAASNTCPNNGVWVDDGAARGCMAGNTQGQPIWRGKVEFYGTVNIETHISGDMNKVTRWTENDTVKSMSSSETVRYAVKKVGMGFTNYDENGKEDGPSSKDGETGVYQHGVKVGMWRKIEVVAPGLAVQVSARRFDENGNETEEYLGSTLVKKTTKKMVDSLMSQSIMDRFDPTTGHLLKRCEMYLYGNLKEQKFTDLVSFYDVKTGNIVLKTNWTSSGRPVEVFDPATGKSVGKYENISKRSSFLGNSYTGFDVKLSRLGKDDQNALAKIIQQQNQPNCSGLYAITGEESGALHSIMRVIQVAKETNGLKNIASLVDQLNGAGKSTPIEARQVERPLKAENTEIQRSVRGTSKTSVQAL